MRRDIKYVVEKWDNVEARYRVKKLLYEEKTGLQHIQLVDTYAYGKMLLLDGIVQTTEKDEFIYHEMMVHVPMISHPNPEKILIIGGGDGGILREVLRHSSVKKVFMVEIDSGVIDLCKQHLPEICNQAFEDKRTEVVINDGSEYVRNTSEKFDVVIIDSPDPVGPAQVLFSREFYSNIQKLLNDSGIMVRQTGSISIQPNEQTDAYKILYRIFSHTNFYLYAVPTYIGGLFSTIFCSDCVNPMQINIGQLQKRFEKIGIDTMYYSPGIHSGSFHLPLFFKKGLKE